MAKALGAAVVLKTGDRYNGLAGTVLAVNKFGGALVALPSGENVSVFDREMVEVTS